MSRVGVCAAYGLGAAFVLGVLACGSSDSGSGATAGAPSGGASAGGLAGSGAGAPSTSGGTGGAPNAAGAPSGAGAGAGGSAGRNGTAGSAGAGITTGGLAGAAGATAKCVSAGTELCEDFESGSLDPQRWTQSKSANASIAVETGTVHGGTYAVHLKFVAGAQSTVTIAESATFAAQASAPANKFYSRMYAYWGPDIPKAATGDFHTGFMVGSGKNDKGDVTVGMGMIGSDQQYLGYSIFFGSPKYEFGPWSNPRIIPKMWQCIELLEDGTDPSTEVRKVWLNDTEMKELESDSAKAGGTANPNHLPPKFDKVSFGVMEYHPIPTLSDMWIDDIKISANKIGCN